ncbi:winged helix-turn-helix transcriptional regulator, partial [Candidatus Woesearchaeota archaeon]|nr:winged helix-turn-helix transcriptional regulator [Candidatus Woesearchaeota archaeon]
MNEKIVLDKKTFKALSVDNRVNILKILTQRNHTLSELASDLDMSNSAVKEHLDVLVKAGLIKQLDEGRKWKYYKLTFKGKNFISPKEVRVLFAFAISTIAAIGASFYLFKDIFFKQEVFVAKTMAENADMMMAAPVIQRSIEPAAIPWFPIIVLALSLLTIGYSLGFYLKKN